MSEENTSQEFRWWNVDETKKLFRWRNRPKWIDE